MSATKKFLLDMDGALVRGREPIPGAQQFIGRLLAGNLGPLRPPLSEMWPLTGFATDRPQRTCLTCPTSCSS